ncbi:MAG TPA: hypothetical protein VGN23_07635, partial [Verrucomicrobiae bacterium]
GTERDWKQIGFERKNVFKARPHPNLLLQEKEQREDMPGLVERQAHGFRRALKEMPERSPGLA